VKKYFLFVVVSLLSINPPSLAAQLKIEIVPLQHRNTSEIILIIKPLVGNNGTVTGIRV